MWHILNWTDMRVELLVGVTPVSFSYDYHCVDKMVPDLHLCLNRFIAYTHYTCTIYVCDSWQLLPVTMFSLWIFYRCCFFMGLGLVCNIYNFWIVVWIHTLTFNWKRNTSEWTNESTVSVCMHNKTKLFTFQQLQPQTPLWQMGENRGLQLCINYTYYITPIIVNAL